MNFKIDFKNLYMNDVDCFLNFLDNIHFVDPYVKNVGQGKICGYEFVVLVVTQVVIIIMIKFFIYEMLVLKVTFSGIITIIKPIIGIEWFDSSQIES